jgi:predicted nucleic acid-binding protein
MNAPEFLDTNVLIYAYSPDDPRKQEIARELLKRGVKGECIVSVQVLAELAATLLHKIKPPTPPEEVADVIDLLATIPTVQPDADAVRRAVQAHQHYKVHFYDGMIIAAAERAGCKKIWSEDLNAGQEYFGVRIENPFA